MAFWNKRSVQAEEETDSTEEQIDSLTKPISILEGQLQASKYIEETLRDKIKVLEEKQAELELGETDELKALKLRVKELEEENEKLRTDNNELFKIASETNTMKDVQIKQLKEEVQLLRNSLL